MKAYLILYLCSGFAHNLLAQISNTYQTETIYLHLNSYVKDESIYPMGVFTRNLKREMAVSKEAMVLYQRQKNQRILAFILSSAGLVAQMTAIGTESGGTRDALILSGLACAVISLPFSINADRNLNRAVWVRNGEVLSY